MNLHTNMDLTPKLSIDVKTKVFAKPQSPFIKKAHTVAIIHQSILFYLIIVVKISGNNSVPS